MKHILAVVLQVALCVSAVAEDPKPRSSEAQKEELTAEARQVAADLKSSLPEDSEARAMLAEFRDRRDFLIPVLNTIPGMSCRTPAGAFYAFPNISGLGISADDFADRLLQDHGVATLAGTAFGPAGAGHLRLSYANSLDNLHRAVERIRDCARSVAGPMRSPSAPAP